MLYLMGFRQNSVVTSLYEGQQLFGSKKKKRLLPTYLYYRSFAFMRQIFNIQGSSIPLETKCVSV